MAEEKMGKVNIDGVEYNLEDMSETAKQQIQNLQFVDAQLQQLHNELAVADTARIGYTRALTAEVASKE